MVSTRRGILLMLAAVLSTSLGTAPASGQTRPADLKENYEACLLGLTYTCDRSLLTPQQAQQVVQSDLGKV